MDKLIESISEYASNPAMDPVVMADYSNVVSQLREFRWARAHAARQCCPRSARQAHSPPPQHRWLSGWPPCRSAHAACWRSLTPARPPTRLGCRRARVYVDPNCEMEDRIKKLRQANFKLEYKQRASSGNPGPPRRRASAARARKQRSYDTDDDSI